MKKLFILSICLIFICVACEDRGILKKIKETDTFIYYCSSQDSDVIDDIDKTLDADCPIICKNLEYEYNEKITVEVYPDQKSYDESLTDKSVIGSPACSGYKKIKMVSPTSPIEVSGFPYEGRLLMAVHEYVHLMIDEINNETPIWLDEGLACYEGSKESYEQITQLIFPKVPEISFNEIENSYYNIPAADVYSYSAVQFIIEHFGYEKLNQLIRHPSDFEKILSIKKDEFSKEWNTYIQMHYRTNLLLQLESEFDYRACSSRNAFVCLVI